MERVGALWMSLGHDGTDVLDLRRLLVEVTGLVVCDYASLNQIDEGRSRAWSWYTPGPALVGADHSAFARYVHQHPVLHHVRTRGDGGPWRISDVAGQRYWRSLDLYDAFFRPLGVEHQASFTFVGPSADTVGVVALNRTGSDFEDSELALLSAVRPLFVSLNRLAGERRRARASLARPDRPSGQGVAIMDMTGHWEWMDGRAADVLEACFVARSAPGRPVPEQLLTWLTGSRSSCRIERGDLAVTVLRGPSLDGRVALFLHAQPASASRLTDRERQVLALVGEGLTNAQIASRLAVRPRTVDKHLERVFDKLGVDNRTSAALTLVATD